jgi:transposase
MIQALDLGERMRYDLTDFEWSVIEPVLPKVAPRTAAAE